MLQIECLSLKLNKCFQEDPIQIGWDKPITLIVGPNNCGKSVLLRSISTVLANEPESQFAFDATFFATFSIVAHDKLYPTRDEDPYNMKLFDECTFAFAKRSADKFWKCDQAIISKGNSERISPNDADNMTAMFGRQGPICSEIVYLGAERDVKPDATDEFVGLGDDGTGATNLVRAHLQSKQSSYTLFNRDFIEEDVLRHLNAILAPTPEFTRIDMEYVKEDTGAGWLWQVRLTSKGLPPLPLNELGSGVKSALLVILAAKSPTIGFDQTTHGLAPDFTDHSSRVVFLEEPENNLHPAAQRRLARFIVNATSENSVRFFITSHSTAFLNAILGNDCCSVLHIQRRDVLSRVTSPASIAGKYEMLLALGASPSDLFLSNGLIWVEGPSDRIYLNHWISLASNGLLIEGVDYQFIMFGGALLSHYTIGEVNSKDLIPKIELMQIGLHHFVVCDSDSSTLNGAPTKPYVEAIRQAFKRHPELECKLWVTSGREIENYIPASAFKRAYGFEDGAPLNKRIWSIQKEEGWLKRNLKQTNDPKKVDVALKLVRSITLSEQLEVSDWLPRMQDLVQSINSWRPTPIDLSACPIYTGPQEANPPV